MKPEEFPQQNKDLTKPNGWTDEQCNPLPVFTDGKVCISLWRPTIRERFSILFFGHVWLFVHSGYTQPPVDIQAKAHIFEEPKESPLSEI